MLCVTHIVVKFVFFAGAMAGGNLPNPCLTNNGGCEQVCRNLFGTAACECLSGYLYSAISISVVNCTDKDECASSNGGCEQNCINTNGSYACSCNVGYTLNADNHTCDGACSMNTDGCAQMCNSNSANGSAYTCSCHRHFVLNADQHACDLTCEIPFRKFGDGCYSFTLPSRPTSHSWAQTQCSPITANLAWFTTDVEYSLVKNFIKSFIPRSRRQGKNFWIGAKEIGPLDQPTWIWYPNNTYTVDLATSWYHGRPNHQHRCGVMYGAVGYALVDVYCELPQVTEEYGWICRAILDTSR